MCDCPSEDEGLALAASQAAGEVHLLGVCVMSKYLYSLWFCDGNSIELSLTSAKGYAIREKRGELRLMYMVFEVVRKSVFVYGLLCTSKGMQ